MKRFFVVFLGVILMMSICLSSCAFGETEGPEISEIESLGETSFQSSVSDTLETTDSVSEGASDSFNETTESESEIDSETSQEEESDTVGETSSETLSETGATDTDTQNGDESETVTETTTETVTETTIETVHEYVTEADSGEGYEHIILDRRFDLGFGCEWNLGKKYTLDSGLKQGSVTHYQDIGRPFYVLPHGLATSGEAVNGLIASSGLEDRVYWQFEEGYKKHFVDAEGRAPFELQDHRLVVNSIIARNDQNVLRIEQYNDYLHKIYPELYPESNPLLVKAVESNREGKIVFSYNSYNDISNAAYATSAQFAEDTWPHLLLHQSFAEPVDLAKYSSIEFSMTVKVNRADQINTWPQGESDRYDQPLPPEGAAVSPSESSLQTYFFIRSKKAPYTLGAFVGILLSSTNESVRREHLGIEQNGIDFYRIDLGNKEGKRFGLRGKWLEVGDETTVTVDLIEYLEFVLTTRFDNGNPDSKWYGVGVDDVYLSFFNVGYEYVGNWDCEYELSDLWARGIIDTEFSENPENPENPDIPETEKYDGNWHLSVDEFGYGTSISGESGRIVGAATNNTVGSTITGGEGSCPKLVADHVHLRSGWIAVDGYEIKSFTCKVYSADGSLLKSVALGFYEVDSGVVDHVMNNMGYGEGTSPHRFNGNPNIITLGEYAEQTVTLVYEVELVESEYTVEMIRLEVAVPKND